MGAGAQDALWMQKILEFCNIKPRIRLWTDSSGGSNLSYNPDLRNTFDEDTTLSGNVLRRNS